jgi:hypothetical protein
MSDKKEIDPDLMQAYEALAEAKAKLADPRRLYTRADQLYPPKEFRPSYVDPSMETPVYEGLAGGGATESEISPMDLISEIPSLAKAGLKGIPALLGTMKKKAADTPGEMSLLDSIKLAAKRSKVRAPDMEKANIEREIQRNRPKDFFDKAKEKATQRDFENIKKSLGKADYEQRQKLKDAGFSDEEISELLSRYANDAF